MATVAAVDLASKLGAVNPRTTLSLGVVGMSALSSRFTSAPNLYLRSTYKFSFNKPSPTTVKYQQPGMPRTKQQAAPNAATWSYVLSLHPGVQDHAILHSQPAQSLVCFFAAVLFFHFMAAAVAVVVCNQIHSGQSKMSFVRQPWQGIRSA